MAGIHDSALPLTLRAWSGLGRFAPVDAQLTISGRLAARRLQEGRIYRAAGGYRLQIDPADPFQAAMALGLFDRHGEWLMRRFVRPNSTALDVGAHMGYFALRLARLVGPSGAVHAFEPDPRLHPRLAEHVQINGFPWVTVNACGLSDREDDQTLTLLDQLGWSSVATTLPDAEQVSVPMTTLDHYVEDHQIDPAEICFIKVDVEGAEFEVLRGGQNTLRATSAAVLVEHVSERSVAIGRSPDEVPALMREFGFQPYFITRRRGRFELVPGVDDGLGPDLLFVRRPL